jgi:hypothetical protein
MTTVKTDKQLVWDAVKEIERKTMYNGAWFHMPDETIWKDFSSEDKLRVRALLLENGIVSIYNNSPWAFALTSKGMSLKESDLKDNGKIKKKYSKELIRGVIIATISALLGLATATIQARYLSDSQPKTLVLPKIQIVHDTIYKPFSRHNPPQNSLKH